MAEEVGQAERVSRGAGIRVREIDLGDRALIGSGAATEVYRLAAFTVPGYRGGLAFVRMREQGGAQADLATRGDMATRADSAVLSQLVAMRWGLDARERAMLDGVAAWPVAVVEGRDGEVVGCLVPLAAHPFYYVPADEKKSDKLPQSAKWLVVAPKRARRAGADAVAERDLVARCTVLARVCLLLGLLHRQGVVFGDLSERSVLFGVGEFAETFVVGCEGAVLTGEGALQRNSAGWAAPETFGGGEVPRAGGSGIDDDAANDGGDAATDAALSTAASVQSVETDRYKLGLLILRVLAPSGDGLERSRDAGRIRGVLDQVGERMLGDALGDVPEKRPSASEWYEYLRGVIVENLEAPVIRSVLVSPALVAEGDEVWLEVELGGAQQLTIEMPGRGDITREVGGRVVSERFTARQSGRISVRARNEHGETRALSNLVRVLPVPAPTRVEVEAPDLSGVFGMLPDLGPLERAVGISADTAGDGSIVEGVAGLRARIEADAMPLNDLLRIGLEAERVSRERDAVFPSFERFLGDITDPRTKRG